MTAPPMPRWQNAVALAGTLAAAGALLPLAPRYQVLFAGIATATIVIVLIARLRAHSVSREKVQTVNTYARIDRIRAQRAGGRRSRR
jgi:O-antigen/teichoic acid export membrane protein